MIKGYVFALIECFRYIYYNTSSTNMNLFLTDRNPLIVWQLTLLQGFTNSTNFVEVTSSSANMSIQLLGEKILISLHYI